MSRVKHAPSSRARRKKTLKTVNLSNEIGGQMKKIVLTGAAGRLGSYLREPLTKMADTLVSSDIATDIGKLYPGEQYVRADLAKLNDIMALLKGADMAVHFGAIGDEAPFEELLGPNIIGAYNIWEAAYRNGVRRVIYASSTFKSPDGR